MAAQQRVERAKLPISGFNRPFRGEEHDVAKGWVGEVKRYKNAGKLTDAETLMLIMQNLEGRALTFANEQPPEVKRNWYSLLQALNERWNPVRAAQKARTDYKVRQRRAKESPIVYLEELTRLRRKGWPLEQAETSHDLVIERFMDTIDDPGLENHLDSRFNYMRYSCKYPSMAKFTKTIQAYGCFMPRVKPAFTIENDPTTAFQQTGSPRTFNPPKQQPARQNIATGDERCFYCNETGHRRAKCPHLRVDYLEMGMEVPPEEINFVDSRFWKETAKTKVMCYNCGKEGHYKRECKEAPVRRPTTLELESKINELRTLIDKLLADKQPGKAQAEKQEASNSQGTTQR